MNERGKAPNLFALATRLGGIFLLPCDFARVDLAALAAADLFADLDEADLDELAALARPFSLAPQDVLFRQGARADRAYLVASGRLAVHLASGATAQTLLAFAQHVLLEPLVGACALMWSTQRPTHDLGRRWGPWSPLPGNDWCQVIQAELSALGRDSGVPDDVEHADAMLASTGATV